MDKVVKLTKFLTAMSEYLRFPIGFKNKYVCCPRILRIIAASKLHDPNAVEVVIDFTHDVYPEHTTFAVRSKTTLETVYADPEYIPT